MDDKQIIACTLQGNRYECEVGELLTTLMRRTLQDELYTPIQSDWVRNAVENWQVLKSPKP